VKQLKTEGDDLPVPGDRARDAVDSVLPYSLIVGQEELKRALEISYVSRIVGGVLVTGQRGTAKTTTVRAFTKMLSGDLPVTLPIGATDDRVLGGWSIDKLMSGEAEKSDGLLVEASQSKAGILYIDEVNLLDDYLVNIILDVVATGILTVQRDYRADQAHKLDFTLIGTMNPDEGSLRPQLLDRFGLVVDVVPAMDAKSRQEIVEAVLNFEAARGDLSRPELASALADDQSKRQLLEAARDRLPGVGCQPGLITASAELASEFQLAGHRGELVLIHAAKALAAISDESEATTEDLAAVAKMALVHRRVHGDSGSIPEWTVAEDGSVTDVIRRVLAG
jgi:magnesium chelatase subunit I